MRKAKRKIIELNGNRYTLGEPDYPKIRKSDLFYCGGFIAKCHSRVGNMINYFYKLKGSAQNTLCRKVIKVEPIKR